MTVRTRFAPSPTGYLHVGGLRTALYSYLLAKKSGGQFLLRIEDTDQERLVDGSILQIVRSLGWAGILPDEGVVGVLDGVPEQKGSVGPYIQSERLSIYQEHVATLLKKGSAYYCFCTPERLTQLREVQQLNKQPTKYDGLCRTLSAEVVAERVAGSEPRVVRLKVPSDEELVVEDMIRGKTIFNTREIDDQVLIKSDGFPTYHFAVVVDDHLMNITHVVRGDDWMSSTPKHILLYKAFGWTPPLHAHAPNIMGDDGLKLSKRRGDVSVEGFRAKGYLPAALINFLAFLGWNPGTEKELYSLDELIADFSLDKVSKSGAVFNYEKLNWYNKQYLKNCSLEMLAALAAEFFLADPFYAQYSAIIQSDHKRFGLILSLERERVTTLAELPGAVRFVFAVPAYEKEILVWRKGTIEEVKTILPEVEHELSLIPESDWNKETIEKLIGVWIQQKNYSNGSVLWPLRVALSGQQNSPGPYDIAAVLRKDESLRRIRAAVSLL